jgi:hypothetical protein
VRGAAFTHTQTVTGASTISWRPLWRISAPICRVRYSRRN